MGKMFSEVVKYCILLSLAICLNLGNEGLMAGVPHTKRPGRGIERPAAVIEPRPEALQPGQYFVVTSVPEDADGPGVVEATICVEAPPEEVWPVVTDYEGQQETVPFVHYCKVVEESENGLVLDYVLKGRVLLIFPWELKLRLALQEMPAEKISFHLLEGSMKRYEGYVTLTPRKGRLTLLTYQAAVQPNFYVPRWALKWGLKKDLPKMLKAMREQVLLKRHEEEG